MRCVILFICLVCIIAECSEQSYTNVSKMCDSYDTVKIVSGYKYSIKEYVVITADGYILKIHRIQSRDKNIRNQNTVLLMGDFWTSSVFWVISGPKYSLAFYLADLGYDIWLGNNRGSKYGQDGISITPDDPSFWYYSFHEFGIYDLPAIIDFILTKIKCNKISYIGWGYGATQFFVMASVKPEYVDKVTNMQALAPVIYIKDVRSHLIRALLKLGEDSIYNLAGRDAVISNEEFVKIGGQKRCLKIAKNNKTCNYIESLAVEAFDSEIAGFPELLDCPVIQAGVRFILHIMQQIKHGFRYYDNGEASNVYIYGNRCVPKYDIGAANLPIAIYYSDGNVISSAKEALKLAKQLPKLIRAFKIKDDKFGQNDYAVSKKGRKLYFKWVKEVLERYNK